MLVRWKLAIQLFWYRLLIFLGFRGEEIYYIGGSEALPPPLTREEEEILLEKLPSGDAAVRGMLIERNLRLVVYIARKFENTGINIEDLVSIGTIGLIKAVNTFDPEQKDQACHLRFPLHRERNPDVSPAQQQGARRSLLRRTPQHRLGRQRAASLGCLGDGGRHRSTGTSKKKWTATFSRMPSTNCRTGKGKSWNFASD